MQLYGDPNVHKFKRSIGKQRMQDPYYELWRGIKKRCFTKSNSSYHNYGARGITMSSSWVDNETGFELFKEYVSNLPNARKIGYSLDRIDNDGDYEPDNLRWASRNEQAINTRRYGREMNNIYPRGNKYRVIVARSGKRLFSKTYKSLEEAKQARDNIVNSIDGIKTGQKQGNYEQSNQH
jgi:hypothetical protein